MGAAVSILKGAVDFRLSRSLPGLYAVAFRGSSRVSGLASGLALAVRPAGLAVVSGAQGWVLKIVSAERLETIFGCP